MLGKKTTRIKSSALGKFVKAEASGSEHAEVCLAVLRGR